MAWSAAAVGWGNAVVLAGRRFGHDQWITLVGVPLFGLAGWWWLARRGFPPGAIGVQLPRPRRNRALAGVTAAAVAFSAVCAAVGLATSTRQMPELRIIRTVIGTAAGEELIHRGVLPTVWASTGVRSWICFTANVVVFGLWHTAGAASGRFNPWEVIGPAALAVPLMSARLRTGSLVAPTAFHAAINIAGSFCR